MCVTSVGYGFAKLTFLHLYNSLRLATQLNRCDQKNLVLMKDRNFSELLYGAKLVCCVSNFETNIFNLDSFFGSAIRI